MSMLCTNIHCYQGHSQRGAWVHVPRHHKSILSRPRSCSLGLPYSSPGPHWGLLSPRPPGLSPLVNSWLCPWLLHNKTLASTTQNIANQSLVVLLNQCHQVHTVNSSWNSTYENIYNKISAYIDIHSYICLTVDTWRTLILHKIIR